MPTGDQTAYLRSKIAERGTKAAKFMMDGFDAWAASERPARVGGAEKTPCETQMTSRIVGGIRYHGKAVPQGYTPGKEMKGGAIDAQWILSNAQKLYEFYQNALRFTKDVKQDLRSEEVPAKYKKIAGQVADMIERVGFGKAPAEALEECMRDDYKSSGRRGGAADWSSWVKEWSQKLVTFYNWYIANKEGIHYVLNMKSINPEGYDYARQFSGMLKSVGLGKPACSCNAGGRRPRVRRGGEMEMSAKPQFAQMGEDGEFHDVEYGDDGKMMVMGRIPKKSAMRARKRGDEEVEFGQASSGMFKSDDQPVGDMEMTEKKSYQGGSMMSHYAKKKVSKMLGGSSCGGRKPSARGAIVKKVMAEQGLSLPQASKYVKEHGLY
jgi:hypothetical protein